MQDRSRGTRRLVGLALMAALAAPATLWAADTPTPANPVPSTEDRLNLARKAIADRDFSTAIRELRLVVGRSPRDADAHNLLGYSYRKQAQPDLARAFEHYRRALEINPRHLGAHEYIGEAYLMDGKPDQAQRHLAELERLCGNRDCEEYKDLAAAIEAQQAGRPLPAAPTSLRRW